MPATHSAVATGSPSSNVTDLPSLTPSITGVIVMRPPPLRTSVSVMRPLYTFPFSQ